MTHDSSLGLVLCLRTMFIGNDHVLEIFEVHILKVKLNDNTKCIVQEIQYVKDLKNNLLLIGQLDDFKCKDSY